MILFLLHRYASITILLMSILCPTALANLLTNVGGELDRLKEQINGDKAALHKKVYTLVDLGMSIDYGYQDVLTEAKLNFLLIKQGLEKEFSVTKLPEHAYEVANLHESASDLIELFEATRNEIVFELIFMPGTVKRIHRHLDALMAQLMVLNGSFMERKATAELEARNAEADGWHKSVKEFFRKIHQKILHIEREEVHQSSRQKPDCGYEFRDFPAAVYLCLLVHEFESALNVGQEEFINGDHELYTEVELEDFARLTRLQWMEKIVDSSVGLWKLIHGQSVGNQPDKKQMMQKLLVRDIEKWLRQLLVQPIEPKTAQQLPNEDTAIFDQLTGQGKHFQDEKSKIETEWELLVQTGHLLRFYYQQQQKAEHSGGKTSSSP